MRAPSALRIARLLGFALGCALSLTPREARSVALPVEVDFTLRFTAGSQGGVALTTSGTGVATVNGSGAGLHLTGLALPASLFATTDLQIPVSDPAAYPLQGAQLTVANGAGSFATVGGGNLGGAMPLPGRLRLCLFGSCDAAEANLSVPLSLVGVGGVATTTGLVNVTVEGAPWTTGTAMLTYFSFVSTAMGFAQGPASGTSSTAQPGGILQLVTPIRITTNIGVDNVNFAFGFLTLRFVPEPGIALQLGAGILLLAALRRRC